MSNIVTGIENISGTMGIMVSNTYPPIGYSIKFYYPQSTSIVINDGSVRWITQDGTKGIFMPYPHDKFPITTDVINYGNQDINSYSVACQLFDPLGTDVINTSLNFNKTLHGSIDTIITFPTEFTPSITGTHSLKTTISGVVNDKFKSNDSLILEIIVVDTSQTQMSLNFARVQSGALSWAGGEGGVGVSFVPPVYPVMIVSTNFVIDQKMCTE